MVDLGNRIKTLRLEKKLTQSQLGTLLGVTGSMVSSYETSIRMPSYEVLISLSVIFNVTTDFLLGKRYNKVIKADELTDDEYTAIINLINTFKFSK